MNSVEPKRAAPGEAQPGGTAQDSPRRWPRIVRVTVLIAVVLGLIIAWGSDVFDKRIDELLASSADSLPKDGRPAFVVTKPPNWVVPRHATLRQRLLIVYFRLRERFATKKPNAYNFGPAPIHACSVDWLLNDCREVAGKRYLIAREALGGVVYFGNTRTLNGAQWVAAFEQALRDGGLLLLSNTAGVVKVIPKTKLDAYRKAGLVKSGDQPM